MVVARDGRVESRVVDVCAWAGDVGLVFLHGGGVCGGGEGD